MKLIKFIREFDRIDEAILSIMYYKRIWWLYLYLNYRKGKVLSFWYDWIDKEFYYEFIKWTDEKTTD